jgi:hypothetical protein
MQLVMALSFVTTFGPPPAAAAPWRAAAEAGWPDVDKIIQILEQFVLAHGFV